MTERSQPSARRKLALHLATGAVVGFLASYFGLIDGALRWADALTPGAVALAATGMVYALAGLMVGIGALFPRAGAVMLNVHDRDDLIEQRSVLTGSAIGCMALGAALIVVPLAGAGRALPPAAGVAALAAAMVIIALITLAQWRLYDELLRDVSRESSGWTLAIVVPVLAIWAAMAHGGMAGPLDPLGVIAVLMAGALAGTMIASARRGLLSTA